MGTRTGNVKGKWTKLAVVAALALSLAGYVASLEGRKSVRPTGALDQRFEPAWPSMVDGLDERSGDERRALQVSDLPDDPLADPRPPGVPALGTLEIQVQRMDAVAADARAWLVPGYHRQLPADLRTPPFGLSPTFVAANDEGVLRFSGLAPGPYRTAIELADLRLEQGVRLLEGRSVTRIVIRLGAGTVAGFVFDEAGEPARGALLQLCRPGYGRNPPPFECFTQTDQNGFYRFQQVAPGLQAIAAHPGGSMAEGGAVRECLVPVAGEVRLDFGSSALESILWTGHVRNSAGDPVPGPGEIRVHDEQQDEARTLPLGADGSFELRLRPGSHHLWVQPAGFFPQKVDLGLHDVPAADLRRDLILHGTRVHLRLTLPPDGESEPNPVVRPKGDGQAFLRLVRLPDGSWVHDGLAPGEYILSARPLLFAETHGPDLPFTVPTGLEELALDLWLESEP